MAWPQCCLGLRLGGLHAGEETGPGRDWVADMEVNECSQDVGPLSGSNLSITLHFTAFLCLGLFGWFQFYDNPEASTSDYFDTKYMENLLKGFALFEEDVAWMPIFSLKG